MDDNSVIVNNPDIRSFANFLANTFPGRPIREISYLLDYFLFGLDPWGYHFQNILWHALDCWLVYFVAIRLNLSATVAWLSSILFLVHPIHVEVVANSSHRKDSLALAFLLMALLMYMKAIEQKTTLRRLCFFCGTLILWIIAFFAKGNSLVFPIIVIAYEYALIPEDNRILVRWNKLVPFLSGLSAVGLVGWYFYISTLPSFKMAIIGAFVKTENLVSFSVYAYVLMVMKSFAFMVSKLIIPLDLSMEYIFTVPKSFLDIWVVSSLIIVLASCLFAFRWKKNFPQAFFLLVLVAILWLPTANIVWHFSYFAADRYMYAPSSALCLMVVLTSERMFGGTGRYFVLSWFCILCVCSILTWQQAKIWQNETSLYSNMLKVSPRSLEAMIGLANAYYSAKEFDISSKFAQQAISRDFTDYRPYLILGNINYVNGRLQEARELLLDSLKKNRLAPEVHCALGAVYDDLGESNQAIESFKAALKLRPDFFEANTSLGVAYERAQKYEEAELALNRALAANRNYVPAWFNLGVVRYKNNDKKGARMAFTKAVELNSMHVDALTNLSVVCKEIGDDACYKDTVRRLAVIMSGAVKK